MGQAQNIIYIYLTKNQAKQRRRRNISMRIHGGLKWRNLVRELKRFESTAPLISRHVNHPHNLHSPISVTTLSHYFRFYSTGTFFVFVFGFCFCLLVIIVKRKEIEGLNLKLKRTEVMQQPQLSADLVRIMEQRLSAIEHRTACLQDRKAHV